MSCLRALLIIVLLSSSVVGNVSAAEEISLLQAYELALESDTTYKVAAYQLDATQARLDGALALFYPNVSAFGQFSTNQVVYESEGVQDREYDGERYGLQLSQRVLDWAAMAEYEARSATLVGQSSILRVEQSMLALRTAELYFATLAAQGAARAFGDEVTAVNKQLEQSTAMLERQLLPLQEYLELAARRDLLLTRQLEAENNAELSLERFYQLVGSRDVRPRENTQVRVTSGMPGDLEEIIADALQMSPRVEALRQGQEAAKAQIKQTWGGYIPTVNLVANKQYSDVGFDNQTSPARTTTYVGLNFNWSLFEGGGNNARLRESWANYYAAGERLLQEQRDLEREIRESWLGLESTKKQAVAAEQSLKSAQTAHGAALKAFELGAGRLVDVLFALSAITRAELNVQQAAFDNALNNLRLEFLTDKLTPESLRVVFMDPDSG